MISAKGYGFQGQGQSSSFAFSLSELNHSARDTFSGGKVRQGALNSAKAAQKATKTGLLQAGKPKTPYCEKYGSATSAIEQLIRASLKYVVNYDVSCTTVNLNFIHKYSRS